MGAVEMDRQAIERRDFPIVRRGYDPASVDAHLRALSAQVEELARKASGVGRDSIASAAGAQVQGILEAAQSSAQAIEGEAAEHAARVREEAAEESRRTREHAIATAQERIAAVTAATDALLQRVAGLDGEARTLLDSLRGGAGRLVVDLEALGAEMGALYDAAAGRAPGPAAAAPVAGAAASQSQATPAQAQAASQSQGASLPEARAASIQNGVAHASPAPTATPASAAEPEQPASPQRDPERPTVVAESATTTAFEREDAFAEATDVDGARLVALNMALNGDSREATGRYLAEHFNIAEPDQLLDEVFAAIEG
jgi:DivIVA domain-containing protein